MPRQALVIGLGQFGMAVAQSLAKKGCEVMAIDLRMERVEVAGAFANDAVQLDATDEAALAQVDPASRDLAVCTIGDDSKEASIICTALLRQQGVPRLVARATDELHARILRLVGAHDVVNPEYEFGQRLANRLLYEGVVSDMPLGGDLWITEFRIPERFAGKTLRDLALPSRHGIMVVAHRHAEAGAIELPNPAAPLRAGDDLIVVSREAALSRLLEED